ncbi:A/G-specific adenine glycosylase [Paenibacillus sp. KN14-4R]|uniref:A/G-specific adenine glycosylase n=1 Tax=Paenibacillus sp. KN14-4R TaxID=3445773 RepID=UPI003FA12F61
MTELTHNIQKNYFSTHLLAWYREHKRDLPWRRSRDPYYIWVSEVMLQQTRVDTVIPYWHRFLDKFPTVQALAEAPEEEVLKAWEGLGYYSRARNLQSAVREVHECYGGVVPDEKEAISSLKGVGPYTSGAVLSIAYNKPEPAVDGNVMRVLSRYFNLDDDIAKPRTRVRMESLAQELIPEGAAGDFNQGLMELGATVCTPKSPSCLTCPVMEHCAGRIAGKEEVLPVKTKAKPPRPERRLMALIEGTGEHAGKVLIRQRPQEGLLARMWELPHMELEADGNLIKADPSTKLEKKNTKPSKWVKRDTESNPLLFNQQDENYGTQLREHMLTQEHIPLEIGEWMMDVEHIFSHIQWQMSVYRSRIADEQAGLPGFLPFHYRWLSQDEMERYAFPNVFLRVLEAYFDR